MSWDLSSEEVICDKLESQQRTIEAFSRKIKEQENVISTMHLDKIDLKGRLLEAVATIDNLEAAHTQAHNDGIGFQVMYCEQKQETEKCELEILDLKKRVESLEEDIRNMIYETNLSEMN